ncbi:MAG: hypothetical protein IM516_12620 [Pseudanabaena sp. M158S2SP1A06QC]|nr:hypothetical protein [Pseudanabaena mucicola]MCA6575446.1 hypothetical protein [Pseudanabaena sp. M53BS1SP1A06MG]MCA6582891.1 hypothetical protein [Pseudanabaena sp. M34BS1SP1A06MG]MCA6589838.1 hypothetical protein [Pseudanabaena sp. M109S1SP1A06QC]MCA6594046.1 hypothetical protein [Pseudanabaena sp. M38BS1SP1A06MG]MCA6594814.1 hypothetical protein [Pseudanabaena sp. M046S1SP1A06QC]MCA6601047.1 hypothetical protein [Pseudanabaena sp. M57BS1SP1A06MG]MCA6604933.1 hypothetical protein [Pseud
MSTIVSALLSEQWMLVYNNGLGFAQPSLLNSAIFTQPLIASTYFI